MIERGCKNSFSRFSFTAGMCTYSGECVSHHIYIHKFSCTGVVIHMLALSLMPLILFFKLHKFKVIIEYYIHIIKEVKLLKCYGFLFISSQAFVVDMARDYR